MKKHIILAAIAPIALFSCQSMSDDSNKQKSIEQKVQEMSQCEQVKALIKSHKKGFEIIRARKTNTKFADIWEAKYHLVGKGCQILRWKNNKYSYMCSVTSPGEEVAMERYTMAKSQVSSCLGEGWTLNEKPRPAKNGMIAIYSHKDHKTAVATHAFETNGIFNHEWTNYVYVGDQERIK